MEGASGVSQEYVGVAHGRWSRSMACGAVLLQIVICTAAIRTARRKRFGVGQVWCAVLCCAWGVLAAGVIAERGCNTPVVLPIMCCLILGVLAF